MQNNRGALRDGILRNVFIVIDQQCVQSLLCRTPNVDDAWVYAVDPDYLQTTDAVTKETQPNEYRGYLRVRLQQLVDNFFDARDSTKTNTLCRRSGVPHNLAGIMLLYQSRSRSSSFGPLAA
jgi:hypothetical protein